MVDGPGETRMALSVAADGGLTEFYEPPPPIAAEHWDALEAAVAATAADWVALSGSLPPGAPSDAYARLAGAARRSGARVALDARGDGLFAGLHANPDFVKVNASEAAELGVRDRGRTPHRGRRRRRRDHPRHRRDRAGDSDRGAPR